MIPGLGVTTAYSVQGGNSGEVTVSVDRLEDGISDDGGARIWVQADVATGPVADCRIIPG